MIRRDKLVLKGSPLAGENPQPFFRQPDLSVAGGPCFPENKKYSFGRETGFKVLPYTMQDRYTRTLVDMEFPSVVMENSFLRAEFIPALGGRLWSLYDKQRERDIVYRNPVFRPANLAIRDAWFSGGIEWNIGRLGHSVHTCSPVFAGIVEDENSSVLRLWEFERQSGLYWRIEFSLPENSQVLFAYTRIENPGSVSKPLYWWTNAAVPQTPGLRIFSAADEVIYIVPNTGNVKTMDYGRLPDLPLLRDMDASYPALFDYSNEYFFQNDRVTMPWESAVYEDGYAYGEMSSSVPLDSGTLPEALLYRKMFCWGTGPGGRRWQEFLSLPGQEYVEVQSGLAPTQLHTADIGGGETIDWVQAFTSFQAEPERAHQRNYPAASAYVAGCLTERISPAAITAALAQGRERAGTESTVLFMGSGWGALEQRLKKRHGPAGLNFPNESIGEAEAPWEELLRTGTLPTRPPEAGPGSFVIDPAWEKLLEASLTTTRVDWLTPYHLGVIAFERGDHAQAAAHWKESIARAENSWAYRNLALAALQSGDTNQALEYYGYTCHLPDGKAAGSDISFMEEYIPLLLTAGKEDAAETELRNCIRKAGSLDALSIPLLEAAAWIALNRGDDQTLDQLFVIEPAHIREGNTALVEIWVEREIRRLTGTGIPRAEAEHQVQSALALGKLTVPAAIDFRMYARKAE